MTQQYGGNWTMLKLEVIREYLDAYFKVMKKQSFKLCYIDAFAGSGFAKTRVGDLEGSALQALEYPFSRFYFIEENAKFVDELKYLIQLNPENKGKDIQLINGNCNEILQIINKTAWIRDFWRGIIFLDPYATELDWASLETIAKTKAFDVWYLFPLSATLRCLKKDGKVDENNRKTIDRLLGTHEWQEILYKPNPQVNIWGEETEVRSDIAGVKKYIVNRLSQVFTRVLEDPLELQNSKNSTMFLLCFACSSDNPSAQDISERIAKSLVNKARKKSTMGGAGNGSQV